MKNLITLLFFIMGTSALAQTISIQGVLRDPNGRSVDDGTYSVVFKIYDAETGGTELWTDTYSSLQTKHGVFQVNLGENTSLGTLGFDVTYYVGVTVENFAEMTPRIQLTTFPYAMAINGNDNKFPSSGDVVLAQDNFVIQQGELKLEGASGLIRFNDGTTLNSANFSGPAGSLANPTDANINADMDADGSGAINFQTGGTNRVTIANDGSAVFEGTLAARGTNMLIGQEDTQKGILTVWGAGTGSNDGGRVDFFKAADHDDVSDYWFAESTAGDFRIGDTGGNHDRLRLAEGGSAFFSGNVGVTGSLLTVGQNDNIRGLIDLYGAGTGSADGGRVTFFKAADHDGDGSATATEYWFMEAYEDDLRIGNVWNNNDVMFFDGVSNYVGIGDNTPTEARLVVAAGPAHEYGAYGYLNASGTGTIAGGVSAGYSIYATQRVGANEFNAFSDERIKNVLSTTNSKEDLDALMQIKITNYEFIDKIEKGYDVQKKVIAQELEKVYPRAVSKSKDFVPSVYELALKLKYNAEEKALKITTEKAHEFVIGDIARLIVEDETLEKEVVKVINKNTFIISVDKAYDKVFVYGKKVDDFRSVDYDAISMLNVSATQELVKRTEEQAKRISALEAENADLKKKLELLNALEAKVDALIKSDKTNGGVMLGQN